MKREDLVRWCEVLAAFQGGEREPRTVEESIAAALVGMSNVELRELARRLYRRGFQQTLGLVHAEFLRRRHVAPVAA